MQARVSATTDCTRLLQTETRTHRLQQYRVSSKMMAAEDPFGKFGFNTNYPVIWTSSDADIHEGTVGRVIGFTDDRVRVKFPSGTWIFKPEELRKVGISDDADERHGLRANDAVLWTYADDDIAAGSKGTVVGFKGDRVQVKFPNGTWTFKPEELLSEASPSVKDAVTHESASKTIGSEAQGVEEQSVSTLAPTAETISAPGSEPNDVEGHIASMPTPTSEVLSAHGMVIPCHIHQTWKTNEWAELPDWVQTSVTSFKGVNPGCNHTLWSDADIVAFIGEKFPAMRESFLELAPVQRADMFRYAVIYHFGGIYADVDVTCSKPINEWGVPPDTEFIVGYETAHHLSEREREQLLFGRPEQFEQWMFGAIAGHPALKRCLDSFAQRRMWGVQDTIELTGPSLFSDSVHEFLWQYGKPTALPDVENLVFPPGPGPPGSKTLILSAAQASAGGATAGVITDATLFEHHFRGTWKK